MKLKRRLGLVHVFAITSGAMISSGLFILPGLAAARAGPAVVLSYLIAGLVALPAALSKAELTTAMPKAGADYFYIYRSMGPAIGTVGGFSSWLSLSLKSSFALAGMAAYATIFIGVPPEIAAAVLLLVFVLLNVFRPEHAGNSHVVLFIVLVGLLVYFVFRGAPSVMIENFTPFAPQGVGAVFGTAGFVFISFGGLTKAASIAEEVKRPGKNLPLGMFFSLLLVTVLYSATVFVAVGVLPSENLHSTLTPISDTARVFGHGGLEALIAIAAVLAFVSTANAGIVSASRYPIAMSRDRILPAFFRKVSRRFESPQIATAFTGLFMLASIFFLKLEMHVKMGSTLLLMLYVLANLAVILMRESKMLNYRPKFRSPLYPWTQIAGSIGGIFLIVRMGTVPILLAVGFCALMFAWYLLYVRSRSFREFALLRIMERITSKELTRYSLETELKEILRERDQIVEDRFDHLIKECPILDIDGHCDLEDFFTRASAELSARLGVRAEQALRALHEREKQSSTVIAEGVAIPHIIVEGKQRFSVVVARSREGIDFSEHHSRVHAVFLLAGTRDERNFHLRALAAIAQIVQQPRFEERWMQARGEQELRDIILLGERKRHTPSTRSGGAGARPGARKFGSRKA